MLNSQTVFESKEARAFRNVVKVDIDVDIHSFVETKTSGKMW